MALETSGLRLDQVGAVFFTLTGADTNDALAGDRARHGPAARAPLDRDLAERAALPPDRCPLAKRDGLGLDAEQRRVLERYHTIFVRAGAGLDPAGRKRLAEINERLATLGTLFSQNVLADEKALDARPRRRTISPACPTG